MESVCVQSFELEYPKCKKEVMRRLSTIPKHGCEERLSCSLFDSGFGKMASLKN